MNEKAVAPGAAGVLAILAVWGLALYGIDASWEVGAAIGAAGVGAGVLIWKHGVRGIARRVWRGGR